MVQSRGLDFFARVRLINFIRREVEAGRSCSWMKLDFDFSDVQLLFPVIEDDQLLQHEFDRLDDTLEERLAVIESAKLDEPPEDLEAVENLIKSENL